jgi:hypothetical protein
VASKLAMAHNMMAITKSYRLIASFKKWLLAPTLLFLLIESCPAATTYSNDKKVTDGFVMSIMSSTQLNLDKVGIGAGYMGGGPYVDANGIKREGLHASLSIAVYGKPADFQQPDVQEGQTLVVAGYRITVLKIIPGDRGTIVLRIYAAPSKSDNSSSN